MTAPAQAKAKTASEAEVRSIPETRMIPAAFVHGDLLHLTLPGDERIEEGAQDLKRFGLIGPKMGMHQWIEVVNDAGSMWRLMRVEKIFGTPGSGLRGLWLRDVVPPSFSDLADEPIAVTGDWYVRHGGGHRRWMVITPGGIVHRQGINTEAEARSISHAASANPRPL
jgi:hypothetical protein